MRAGELRHKIRIEAHTESQDAYGEPVTAWGPYAELWASKEDLTGSEAFQARQVNAEVTTRFRSRYLDGVTPKMRLLHSGSAYDIQAVRDPDGRERELIILANRGGSADPADSAGSDSVRVT